jgi:hypothetical protein
MANQILASGCGKSTRRANHFWFSEMVSSPKIKNISVFVQPKSDAYPTRLVPPEGRSRVVTSAGRDAVDVKASGAQRQSQGEMNLVSGQLACRMIGAFCVR